MFDSAAGGNGHQNVPRSTSDSICREKIVRSHNRSRLRSERKYSPSAPGREVPAVRVQAYDEFSGQMLRVGRASAIAEKTSLRPRRALRRAHCKFFDASQQFFGETLFHAAASLSCARICSICAP